MSSKMEILYLSQQEVAAVGLEMKSIIDAVENAFREKGNGRTEMPPKPGIHPRPDAFIHAMPAYVPNAKAAGCKWISGYPENQKLGLPYITGLLVLNDPDTGVPIAVMDAVWITAMRTGAASAVAAKYLARPDSVTLAVIGCGIQGRSHLEAMSQVLPNLMTVKAYDTNPEILSRYIRDMSEKYPYDFIPVDEPKQAVIGSDVVVTAGPILKHPEPVIEDKWFKPGGFAAPVDFDSYWKHDLLHALDKFCTDDTNQMMAYKASGYFQNIPLVYADLGEIVSGKKPGRTRDQERTMAMNLGLAIEDVVVGIRVFNMALEKGIGTRLPLA